MIYVETNSTKPYVNLAFEEYFLKNSPVNEPVLMLWRNEPTVVIGRFQNTSSEINQKYVDENNINVIRRITGGGAVYHDLGTLCYTFILRDLSTEALSFKAFAVPVLEALERLGVNGKMSGRNDLIVDGAKFSGTAMSLYKDSLLFHGTILYNTNLNVLTKALNVKEDKFTSKGIKSVRSRVANILPYFEDEVGIGAFKELLKEMFYQKFHYRNYDLSKEDLKEINELAGSKYRSWDWNYGKNPATGFHNRKKYQGGEIEIYLDLKESKIVSCKIYGDFLGLEDISSIEELLTGMDYNRRVVESALNSVDIGKYLGGIGRDELIECLFEK